MKLKKLILSVLSLFILITVSYAVVGNPVDPSFKPILKSNRNAGSNWCDYTDTDPDTYYPGIADKDFKFKIPARYFKVNDIFELLDDAVNKNYKIAAELVTYCVRGAGVRATYNKGFENFPIIISYYGGKNAVNIIRYIMEEGNWPKNYVTTIYPLKESKRSDITIASEYASKDVVKFLINEAPAEYRANPYTKVMDYLEDPRGKMKDAFDLAANNEILAILKTVKLTSALIEDAVRKSVNYAMTNKDELSRLMEKIKDGNGIVADFLRALDSNSLIRANYI